MHVKILDLDFDLESIYSPMARPMEAPWVSVSDYTDPAIIGSSTGALYGSIARAAVDMLQVDFCRVLILDPEQNFIPRGASFINGPGRQISDSTVVQRIYRQATAQNEILVLRSNQPSLSLEEGRCLNQHQTEAICLVPLYVQGEAAGLMVLGESDTEFEAFHDGKLRLARLMRKLAENTVESVTNKNRVQTSRLDSLRELGQFLDDTPVIPSSHSRKVVMIAETVAEQLGASVPEVQTIGLATLLHDIGKIGVPSQILKKPGILSEDEWKIIRTHPEVGSKIILFASRLPGVAHIVRCHHERYDGAGYPHGLKGCWIPFGARILAVVDTYDTITHGRPYCAARSKEHAIEEINRCAGSQFDPVVVEVFTELVRSRFSF